jgi:dihydropyrimidinase
MVFGAATTPGSLGEGATTMEFEAVIRGGTITTADSSFEGDLGIAEGKVTAVARHLPSAPVEIDAKGLLVLPGAIDVHTHFDHFVEPFTMRNADDYESGSRAAAIGGITTIVNFAFQAKGHSLREAIEDELARAESKSFVDYGVHQCITDLSVPGVLGEIPRLADEGFASVKVFTTTSAYQLPDADILRVLDVAESNGIMVSVHAEDEALCNHLTSSLLERGEVSVDNLPRARPPMAEELATFRVASYARALGAPVYFVHLSSAEALRAVRRVREDGGQIYVETRPVYLYLDETRYELPDREGNKYVCIPPLRSEANQGALWDGLRNSEIQTYATDHAPWQSKQKLDAVKTFTEIPPGVSNVQTSIGMLFSEGVKKGRLTASQLVAVSSANPARLFGMWPAKGTLSPGADADAVLIDPERHVTIMERDMESKADYDPYEGYRGVGWPVMTLLNGVVIAHEGKIVARGPSGRFVKRLRFQPL